MQLDANLVVSMLGLIAAVDLAQFAVTLRLTSKTARLEERVGGTE